MEGRLAVWRGVKGFLRLFFRTMAVLSFLLATMLVIAAACWVAYFETGSPERSMVKIALIESVVLFIVAGILWILTRKKSNSSVHVSMGDIIDNSR